MATELDITGGAVTVRADSEGIVNGEQPAAEAVDVAAGDQADLLLTIDAVEGTVDNFIVVLLTGMSLNSEEGWYLLGSFENVTTAGSNDKAHFSGLLKYIRWKVTNLSGGGSVTFQIRGMLRNS